MTRAYVFVETKAEAETLRRLLGAELMEGVEFVSEGGVSSQVSLARSYLSRRQQPLAFMMASHSLDADLIHEQQSTTNYLLHMGAASAPAKLIVVVPEFEAWFFAAPAVLEKFFREKIPPEFIRLGRRDPVGVLAELSSRKGIKWDPRKALQMADDEELEPLRAEPAVHELSAFLQSMPGDGEAA